MFEARHGRLPGTVYLVGAGPGAADLITVRGDRLLRRADAVVHDDLADPALYEGLDCEVWDVGKRCGRHKMCQPEINALLVELAARHRCVVRLKGGDPFVLGRGSEELLHLAERGIPAEVVPGISSAIAAPQLAGVPVTHRGIADGFTVISAHPRAEDVPFSMPAYDPRRTLVVLMGARTMPRWTAELREKGYPEHLPCAFVTWAARPQMQAEFTTLCRANQLAESLQAPTVAIVGEVITVAAQLRHAKRIADPA